MKHPERFDEFMTWFKDVSEKHFEEFELDKEAYGLDFQKGTKWNIGLSDREIGEFQKELGFEFPYELKQFYKTVNGTNVPGVNTFGESGMQYNYEPIYYSYPVHVTIIKELINEKLEISGLSPTTMIKNNIPFIFPIERFYYMVIDNLTNPIYYISTGFENHDLNKPSVYASLYADSLQSFLIKSVLKRTNHISDLEEFPFRNRESNYWTEKNNR
ncbi:SMI1/KNR4 family protein [Carboxylicivirga caseinilyticus]|uniref:SMI1/KNR4 family protein n=1 Tax=Carboxylicivirga caseinilyticus TaxID=3417572 RepID=UPI003D32E157|nr:SMI1/KNR4 family protein [Marinilabiliaceae bacterium A049]